MKEAKNKNWFARHKILTVLLALVVLGGIAGASGSGNTATKVGDAGGNASSQDGSTSGETEKTKFKAGDVIAFDGKEVTVAAPVRNWNSGNEYIKPDTGNEYVKVQVTIANKGQDQATYNTFDWKMQDSKGVIKDVDSTAFSVDGALNSGELAPGGKVSGFLVFQVPKADKGLVLKYSPSFWTDKNIEIDL